MNQFLCLTLTPQSLIRLGLLSLFLLLIGFTTPAQTTRYVKPATSGTGDGSSWANASADLQAMINATSVQQVWVAAGTYKPTSTSGPDSRTIAFGMKNGVSIYGGFVGTETALSQRPTINPLVGVPASSTLSGEIGDPNSTTDNSYHVVNNDQTGINSTAVLDGFVITRSNANGSGGNRNLGGGMINVQTHPTVRYCLFINNLATTDGGGIYSFSSTASISNSSFQSNSASSGGGLLTSGGSLSVSNCNFQTNLASFGGGVFSYSTTSFTLTNCNFQSNRATNSGGGMALIGSSPKIGNTTFQSNSATDGGGMYSFSSTASISNSSFQSNSATNNGGGMVNQEGSNPTILNCTFQTNLADFGGGMFNYNSSNPAFINSSFLSNSATFGGGLYNLIGSPTLTNCSFQSNTADYGGVMFNESNSNPLFTNGVAFGNGGASTFYNYNGGSLTANYSLFETSTTDYTNGGNNLTVSVSPFASATSTQLNSTAPAINAGNPATISATVGATDLAGNPRFVNTVIDMGAYEYQQILDVFTLKDGSWNDPAVWSVSRVPLSSERVRLRHAVTIPASFQAVGRTVVYESASRLIYSAGGMLRLGQ